MSHIITNNSHLSLVQSETFGRALEERDVVDSEVFAIRLVDDIVKRLHLAILDNVRGAFHSHVLSDDFVVCLIVFQQAVSVFSFVVD